jgi:nucleoside 2-deoxyribosyltransferase
MTKKKRQRSIAICGSMVFSKEMEALAFILREFGIKVFTPAFIDQYKNKSPKTIHKESVKNKVDHDLIRQYFNVIRKCDGILVLNLEKNLTPGYIGGNTFLEMGFAHVLKKQIFVTCPPARSLPYYDEIEAMKPEIYPDPTKIKFSRNK